MFNVNNFIVSQVNPHIVPFLNQYGGGLLGIWEKLLGVGKSLIGNELVHWLTQAATLGLVPHQISRYSRLVTQSYYGHVTIFPPFKPSDLTRLMVNPTPDFIKRATAIAEKRTY